jgi:hypothetical protein
MDRLASENEREDALWRVYEQAYAALSEAPHTPASHRAGRALDPLLPAVPVKHYHASGARLLSIALASLRHAIRLSGLDEGSAGAVPGLAVPPISLAAASSDADQRPPTSAPSPLRSRQPSPDLVPWQTHQVRQADADHRAEPPSLAPGDEPSLPPVPSTRQPSAAPPHTTGTKWNIPARTDRPSRVQFLAAAHASPQGAPQGARSPMSHHKRPSHKHPGRR